jgi:glycosyltransferase involved in cell wall biosynthesis
MAHPPEIFCTVTNDLSYDQRMQRICSSLAGAGYKVTLIGRLLPNSLAPDAFPFEQVRLKCRNNTGKLFYLEYNWKLFRYLKKVTEGKNPAEYALCAIDLDTLLPVLKVSQLRKCPRVYDAHELFTELFEVKRRKLVSGIWNLVERYAVPKFKFGYTVNDFIAGELKRRYGVDYGVIRNMPSKENTAPANFDKEKFKIPAGPFFLYQGAVNEGRSFETLIPAMKMVDAKLVIAGNGNFFEQAKTLAKNEGLTSKVIFTGYLKPSELKQLTPLAFAGITIFDKKGLNQYYSLANRYFDYIQGGIPQVCVNYPEYAALNKVVVSAFMINDVSSGTICAAMNKLLSDDVLYRQLKSSCSLAAENFCWENESRKLIGYWNKVIPVKSNVNQS